MFDCIWYLHFQRVKNLQMIDKQGAVLKKFCCVDICLGFSVAPALGSSRMDRESIFSHESMFCGVM